MKFDGLKASDIKTKILGKTYKTKIQTAQRSFYDRLDYDDVKIFINHVDSPYK